MTYWIEKECHEEFSPQDALVQDLWAAGVFVHVHGVSEESTGLSRENLPTQYTTLQNLHSLSPFQESERSNSM